jgi:hypothetical protein
MLHTLLLPLHVTRLVSAIAMLGLLCSASQAQLEVVFEDFESYNIGDDQTAFGGAVNIFNGPMTATASIREYPVGSGNKALRFAFDAIDGTLNQNVEGLFQMAAMNNPTLDGSKYTLDYDVAIGSGPNNWWAHGGVVETGTPGSGPYGVNINTNTLVVGGDFANRSGALPATPPFGAQAVFTQDQWLWRVVALGFNSAGGGQRVQMFVDNIRVTTLVPEPASQLLGLASAGAMCLVRRRNQR